MVVAQQVPQQRPLNPLRRSHRQWVVQVLTISKLKRWSINYTCGKVIARFDGHIAVYLGDGLLVYFGYPLAHEDDAQRAVRAGLGIVEAVGQLNAGLAERHGVSLTVRRGEKPGFAWGVRSPCRLGSPQANRACREDHFGQACVSCAMHAQWHNWHNWTASCFAVAS